MMTWPDWIQAETSDEVRRTSDRCEDEAAAFVEDSEEIQMEVEARRKREEVVAREIEEIVGEESLECDLETFEGKDEAERKKERNHRRRGGKAGMGTRETDERTVDGNGKGEETGTGGA